MALTHAILALLVESPASGYDLVKRFEGSVGFFWKATHQQVYRELSKLEAQFWVCSEVIPQEGRPDKKMYQITALGQQKLIEWIAEPSEMAPVKDELLVKVFVGALVPCDRLRQELNRHRQMHQEKLFTYQQIQAEFFQDVQALSTEMKFHYLTLRRGIRYESDWIAWCEEALEVLSKDC